jgi:thioredoxin reductase (NADPH)
MGERIQVYGAEWCSDCHRARRFLNHHRIPFEWHDVDGDPEGPRIVRDRNDGKSILPTIVFPDGSHLSEPSDEELSKKVGLETS